MIAYAVTLAAEDKRKEIIEGVLDIHDIAIKEGEQTFSASIAESSSVCQISKVRRNIRSGFMM